jgi:hypothetical protein
MINIVFCAQRISIDNMLFDHQFLFFSFLSISFYNFSGNGRALVTLYLHMTLIQGNTYYVAE